MQKKSSGSLKCNALLDTYDQRQTNIVHQSPLHELKQVVALISFV